MRASLDALAAAHAAGRDAVGADYQFHLEIARATQNSHFADLMASLGTAIIPRGRLEGGAGGATSGGALPEGRLTYLRRVDAEHESLFEAIVARDGDAARAAMRTHLSSSRERRRRATATN